MFYLIQWIWRLILTYGVYFIVSRLLKRGACRNPLEKDERQKRKPYEHDEKKRDAVLKQAFAIDKVRITCHYLFHSYLDLVCELTYIRTVKFH